jgi:hypothetical protein
MPGDGMPATDAAADHPRCTWQAGLMIATLTGLLGQAMPILATAGALLAAFFGYTWKVRRDAIAAEVDRKARTDELARAAAVAQRAKSDAELDRGGNDAVRGELQRNVRPT